MAFITDMLASLTTFCSPHIRHMGYLKEAISMRGRSRRRRAAWQPHLDNTRQFVLSAAENCSSRDRAIVLGSGLLLDLPLLELSALFKEVVLTDVACLPEARREIGKFKNVTFREQDITGIAEPLYLNRHRGIRELPLPGTPSLPGPAPDFVVSLNILSQLWVIPRMFVLEEFQGIDKESLEEWCSEISAAHERMLRGLSCPVCLVADYSFVTRNAVGDVYSSGSTIGSLSLPAPDVSWTWLIDPGEETEKPRMSRELAVGGWNWDEKSPGAFSLSQAIPRSCFFTAVAGGMF